MGVEERSAVRRGVLGRVLCCVDGSRAGVEAVRQGARLRAPAGSLLLVSVATPAAAPHPEVAVALEVHAAAAVREGEREAGMRCESHVLVGDPVDCLLGAARDQKATLAAVGSHGTGRLSGILAGSVATALLHRAPCSVLIARPPRDPARFPARIAVGIDGSEPSRIALGLATDLGARLGVPVLAVAARGAATDLEPTGDGLPALHVDEREPVEALLDAATGCELLILGARGVRGVRALGSVSERVAHRAPASVLVVRGAAVASRGEIA